MRYTVEALPFPFPRNFFCLLDKTFLIPTEPTGQGFLFSSSYYYYYDINNILKQIILLIFRRRVCIFPKTHHHIVFFFLYLFTMSLNASHSASVGRVCSVLHPSPIAGYCVRVCATRQLNSNAFCAMSQSRYG